MATKRRTGIPEGFNLGMSKQDVAESQKPIRAGDYLDEIDAPRAPIVQARAAALSSEPVASPQARPPLVREPVRETRSVRAGKSNALANRARLNVSEDARRKLEQIVDRMARYGAEPDVRASEVLEAAIMAIFDVREHLDLSRVRRRGKFGSPSHRNFPVALADSIATAFVTSATGVGRRD